MAKILITGASGFIGGFLVEHGLSENHTIYAAVRASSNKKNLSDPRINIIHLNLADKKSLVQKWVNLRKEIGKFDYVIHNAGATKVLDKADFETINSEYTKNLVESFITAGMIPDKFIYMSSLAAYGPGNENTFDPIKISDTPNPITNYGKSKLKAEQFLFQQNKVPFLIFRPTGVYGPRDTGYYKFIKSINNHIEIYLGSTHQKLSFIFVHDLVSLIFKSLQTNITNKAYFVTDGKNYTSRQFAAITKKILNKKTVRIIFPLFFVKFAAYLSEYFALLTKKPTLFTTDKYKEITRQNWACDASETINDFNFQPRYNLQLGVETTIEWYKKNRWL